MNYNLYTLEQLDRISRDGDLDEFTKAVLEKALDIEAELDAIKDTTGRFFGLNSAMAALMYSARFKRSKKVDIAALQI